MSSCNEENEETAVLAEEKLETAHERVVAEKGEAGMRGKPWRPNTSLMLPGQEQSPRQTPLAQRGYVMVQG